MRRSKTHSDQDHQQFERQRRDLVGGPVETHTRRDLFDEPYTGGHSRAASQAREGDWKPDDPFRRAKPLRIAAEAGIPLAVAAVNCHKLLEARAAVRSGPLLVAVAARPCLLSISMRIVARCVSTCSIWARRVSFLPQMVRRSPQSAPSSRRSSLRAEFERHDQECKRTRPQEPACGVNRKTFAHTEFFSV